MARYLSPPEDLTCKGMDASFRSSFVNARLRNLRIGSRKDKAVVNVGKQPFEKEPEPFDARL